MSLTNSYIFLIVTGISAISKIGNTMSVQKSVFPESMTDDSHQRTWWDDSSKSGVLAVERTCTTDSCSERYGADYTRCLLTCLNTRLNDDDGKSHIRRQMDLQRSCYAAMSRRCGGEQRGDCARQADAICGALGGKKRALDGFQSTDESSDPVGTTDVEDNKVPSRIPLSELDYVYLRKRGVNDITDVCIAYHCPREAPGTVDYLRCIRNYDCIGKR